MNADWCGVGRSKTNGCHTTVPHTDLMQEAETPYYCTIMSIYVRPQFVDY